MDPNVVIIVVDALRADRVGCLGGRNLTPNIDRFASEGTIFSNAFSTTNVTDPAVTSIQTGRYPLSHGVLNHGHSVTQNEKARVEKIVQLPEALKEAGYRTAKFGRPLGRWHRKGFDIYPTSMESREAFDVADEPNRGPGKKMLVGDVLEGIHPAFRAIASRLYHFGIDQFDRVRSTDAVGDFYSDTPRDEVLDNFSEYASKSGALFSFIHLMNPHVPYAADPELVESLLSKFHYEAQVPKGISHKVPQEFHELISNGWAPNIRDKYYQDDKHPTTAIVNAHYDASVIEADDRVGRIFEYLKEYGKYDDSLIVVMADHGESLTEHGIYYDHHGLYDVTIRVPLIIRPPTGNDRTVSDLIQITDVAPTIQSYTGVGGLDCDGKSLRALIEGGKPLNREFVIAEEAHTQRRRMVRSLDSKLIYLVDGDTICRYCEYEHAPKVEYYNLDRDPYELDNVASDNDMSVEKFRAMGDKQSKEYLKRSPTIADDDNVEYIDENEVFKRLEMLGYR